MHSQMSNLALKDQPVYSVSPALCTSVVTSHKNQRLFHVCTAAYLSAARISVAPCPCDQLNAKDADVTSLPKSWWNAVYMVSMHKLLTSFHTSLQLRYPYTCIIFWRSSTQRTAPEVHFVAVLQCSSWAETEIQALQHRCSGVWTEL